MQRDLAAFQQARDQAADLAQVQLGAGGAGGAEGDAHELDAGQRLVGRLVTSLMASVRMAGSRSSSSTSMPLTTAPKGPTRSWQTRLTSNAANSISVMNDSMRP